MINLPFLSARSRSKPRDPVRPDAPFFAIGDVHGCHTLLSQTLDRLLCRNMPIVLVGDYVDRGDDSASTLAMLYELSQTGQVSCLKGNHEDMMLKFIAAPDSKARRWLRHGGLQTMASFGIRKISETAEPTALVQTRDALVQALGPQLNWLNSLPCQWQSGNVSVVHAGADPTRPMEQQNEKDLMWGHKDFHRKSRNDDQWVIYGHTIVPSLDIRDGRIGIDTGAYATGNLTAIVVNADGVEIA